MNRFWLGLLLLFPLLASAADVTIQWTTPTTNCDNTPIVPGDLTEMEIYIDTQSIPALGDPCGVERDTPPTGGTITVVTPDPNTNSITIDLPAGQTYFLRARVRGQGGLWSNLSDPEAQKIVPFPRPGVPSITIITL